MGPLALRPANPAPEPPAPRRRRKAPVDPAQLESFVRCATYASRELYPALRLDPDEVARNTPLGGRLWGEIERHGGDAVLAAMQFVAESRNKKAVWLRRPDSGTTLLTVLNHVPDYSQIARGETRASAPTELWDQPEPVDQQMLDHYEAIASKNGGKI